MKKNRSRALHNFLSIPDPPHSYGIAMKAFPPPDFYSGAQTRNSGEWATACSRSNMAHIISFNAKNPITDPCVKQFLHTLVRRTREDKLAARGEAFLDAGIMVYVKSRTFATDPIYISLPKKQNISYGHILIILEEESSANVVIECAETVSRQISMEVILKRGSSLSLTRRMQCFQPVALLTAGSIQEEARLTYTDMLTTRTFTKNVSSFFLEGRGACVNQRTSCIAFSGVTVDTRQEAVHEHGHTRSCIEHRSITGRMAKNIFRGLARVEVEALGSEVKQSAQGMLLGDDSEFNAVPVLEIFTNDVSCRHNAATQHIKEGDLFYLMSRGISRVKAKEAIICGFLGVDSFTGDKYKKDVQEFIQKK